MKNLHCIIIIIKYLYSLQIHSKIIWKMIIIIIMSTSICIM